MIDNIPEGPFQEKTKAIIKVPEGSYYAAVEGSRGEFGVFLESRGDKYPYRLKFRSTGLPLVSIMETVCRGAKIADLEAQRDKYRLLKSGMMQKLLTGQIRLKTE